MSEFKFNCSHCGQHLQCEEQYSGREIECPTCHVLIRIPPVPGQTALYEAESGQTWMTHISSRPAPPPGNLSIRPGA